MAGVHPNPGPPRSSALVVCQWNCNGLKNSTAELCRFLRQHNVGICCLQETKLKEGDRWPPSFPGYNLIRQDRQSRSGGGLATLVRHDISYVDVALPPQLANDNLIELQGIQIHPDSTPIAILNVYIPPASSTNNRPINFAQILDLPSSDFMVVGDLNAHHGHWHSAVAADARGQIVADAIENSTAVCLNEDTHTRRPASINQPNSSPDISIVSAHLAPSLLWSTVDTLNSDHLPILISFADFNMAPPRSRKTFTNFRRADWNAFTSELESLVDDLDPPSSCMKGEKLLREAVLTAAKHHIPSGYRQVFIPAFPPQAARLSDERDRLRSSNPLDPEVARLNAEISGLVVEERRARYKEFIEKSSPSQNPGAHFAFMRKLTGKRLPAPENQYITFNGILRREFSAILTLV